MILEKLRFATEYSNNIDFINIRFLLKITNNAYVYFFILLKIEKIFILNEKSCMIYNFML